MQISPIFADMHALRKKENFHIVLWLVKDFAWIMDFKILGLSMALPTVLLAIYLTWFSRKDKTEFAHNLAVMFWICANVIWMFGEFYSRFGCAWNSLHNENPAIAGSSLTKLNQ
jgi:hypothetical protein